jgi:hypothetical protein
MDGCWSEIDADVRAILERSRADESARHRPPADSVSV